MGCGSSAQNKKNKKYQIKIPISSEKQQDLQCETIKISTDEVETNSYISPISTINKNQERFLKSQTQYTFGNNSNQKKSIIVTKYTNIEQDYLIAKKLGAGNLAKVKLGLNKKTQKKVAIKIISKHNLKVQGFSNQTIKQEIKILQQLDHPNLVRLLDLYEDGEKFYIVTEFYNGNTLKDLIEERESFSEQEVASIMKQILSAVNYCHKELKIMHSDLKTENIMFEKKNDINSLKIIDFGFAKSIESNNSNELLGTPYYFSPQMLLKHKIINEKCDIWSLGIILYQLIEKKKPFDGDNFDQLFDAITQAKPTFSKKMWKNYSQQQLEFLKLLLNKDHTKRCSAEEALQSEWIKINTPLVNNFISE